MSGIENSFGAKPNIIPPSDKAIINLEARLAFYAKPPSQRTKEEYIAVLGMEHIYFRARQIIGNNLTISKIFAKLNDPVKIVMDQDLRDEQKKAQSQ